MLIGKELIKSQLDNIPSLPGIYRMLDKEKRVIYIGKAKNLYKRLSQYTLELSTKNEKMISLTYNVDYNITDSESSALLLEAKLIKKFKPKFNILLKDDKSFPFIKLREDHKYPQLLKYRGNDLSKGSFFGPFTSVKQVEITLTELQKIFKLRSCNDNYFNSRTRPCLQYEIKRCYAPCVGKISQEDYDQLVLQVKDFLVGKNKELQKNLSKQMEELSLDMKFEQAAEIRDRIKALSHIQLKSGISAKNINNLDVIAITTINGVFAIELNLYRVGQNCGSTSYFPDHIKDENIGAVLESFLLQFYQNKAPAENIIISHHVNNLNLIIAALKKLHNKNVKISVPQKGEKYLLMEHSKRNVTINLNRYLQQSAKNITALEQVKELFNLTEIPERIEVYDNSHIQGSFAVGAMIVTGKNGFEKKEYRLFNIKGQNKSTKDCPTLETKKHGGDDYAMLSEVLSRRFTRLKKEPEKTPDLIIIDGGKGHLSTAIKIMQEFQLDLPIICIAKGVDRNAGKEQFHRLGQKPFTLDKDLPVMKYLQIIRDEVHNFVIKSHRRKRSNAIKISSLDGIPNIGEKRKKALLNYFGSFQVIKEASALEIAKVEGISKALAKEIYQNLHM